MPTEATQEALLPLNPDAPEKRVGDLVVVLERQGMAPDLRDNALHVTGTPIQIAAAKAAVKGLRLGR